MINLGAQYYRPPFPLSRYWRDDLMRMSDAGFNCVQLWVMWSWVEAKPGVFDFDDYDRLIDGAASNGLNVVLSTIAEVHPCWIHRIVPGCELVTSRGHKVISEHRNECHHGLTPGGCFDHPEVWERMAAFIRATVHQFKARPNLVGWDAWNELRWNVQADGPVCYCPNTVKRYRQWLDERFGGLEGLNREWVRRYDSWEDVQPGKHTYRPFTSNMSFAHFLTWRSNQHAEDRYRIIKAIDPDRPVTAHGPAPCLMMTGDNQAEQALNRGNDWFIADRLDGIGCSNFPAWWSETTYADYTFYMQAIHSAARGKRFWISELQGGRSNYGFNVHAPVRAVEQQRWIWDGIAHGADTVLLWCWRDEVFGSESNGFGFIGGDGFADERIAAMRRTGSLLRDYARLFADYRPAAAEVAVLFSPQTYYLYWAQDATARQPLASVRGFCKALIRHSVPFKIVEEEHLEELAGVKILFLPRTTVLDEKTCAALTRFVAEGGTLYCEAETGAWDSVGIFRYPDARFPARLTGIEEIGRRAVPSNPEFTATLGKGTFTLKASHLLSPWRTTVEMCLGAFAENEGAMLARARHEAGTVFLCGTYLGDAYDAACYQGFEDFVLALVREAGADSGGIAVKAAAKPDFNSYVSVCHGRSQGRDLVFVFFPAGIESATLLLRDDLFADGAVHDLISDKALAVEISGPVRSLNLTAGQKRMAILVGGQPVRQAGIPEGKLMESRGMTQETAI